VGGLFNSNQETRTGCNSNRVKTILSTYYSSDTLDVKTT